MNNDELQIHADRLPDQVALLIAWEDTVGAGELTWEEAARCIPALNLDDAKQSLLDDVADPEIAAGYAVLFLRHPELARWVREQHVKPQEPPRIIPLRKAKSASETTGHLRAAAKAATLGTQPGQWWLEDDEQNYCLRFFPQSDPSRTTVQFVGRKPKSPPALYVDGVPLKMLEPFDEFGEAIARSKDLQTLRAGTACLEIALES